jgi:hypothetical protein
MVSEHLNIEMEREASLKLQLAAQDSAQNAVMQHQEHQLSLEHQQEQQEMKNEQTD